MRLVFCRAGLVAVSITLAACSSKSSDNASQSSATSNKSEKLSQSREPILPEDISESENVVESEDLNASQDLSEADDAEATQRAAQADKHLRVLVSYEKGQFQVEKVTEVARPLRTARGGRTRNGIQYVARGQTSFTGSAPDPRTLHVEVPNERTGKLERRETPTPGKLHFLVLVPIGTDIVDFLEGRSTPAAALRAAKPALGSIDLRTRR